MDLSLNIPLHNEGRLISPYNFTYVVITKLNKRR